MSKLYFRIKSDWSEVVRLRQEIARLENQLNRFNGKASLSVLTKLCDELSAAKSRMQSLLDDAAIAGKQLEKGFQKPIKIDISTSEGQLKAFDAQIMKMCSSLDAYFNGLKSRLRELQSLLGDGQTLMGNIRINDDNSRRIEEVKRQNAELQEQIKQQTAEIEHQQSQWQQLAEAVRNNNVSAIKQLSQQTDEATRRLRMDAAKGSLNGIEAELDELAEKMAVAEGDAERLKAALDDLRSRQSTGDASVTDDKISETEALYRKACDKLSNMKSEYNSMSAEQKKYIDQLKSASGQHTRMRTEIMDAREQMAQLIAAGQTGTPAFRQLAEQAATMQKQITIANATMQYFANPTRHLETLKVAMQGVAGAAGLVTGLFGIFNSESEKMLQIQTRVQSILGIIVGLETTYATVKKTSNVMMAVSEFQAWAATRAKQAEAAATNAGTMATIRHTAAQRVFNAVAKANPYVLLASAIGALGVALFSMAKSTKTATAAQEALNKAQEEQRKINATLGSAIGETIASYMVLQKQWQSLSSAQEKNKWIDENSSKFKQMGLNITDINSAEDAFVNHSKAVINALKARAEAEAWGEIYKERIKKKAENDMNGSVANGRYVENFHAGDKVNVGKLRNTYGKTVSTNTVGGSEGYFRVDGMHFGTSYSDNEFVRLTEASARDLNKKALEIANGITQAEDEAIKVAEKAMMSAQERAAEAAKELGLQSGNTGKGSTNGKTPDEIEKELILREQEAARERQQNLLLQEQSIIDLMDDGAEKELAQMRLNHKKRMVELNNEEQDILNKKIETASKDSKGRQRKGFYTTGQYKNVQLTADDMLGVNSKRISESEAYFDNLISVFKKIESGADAPMKKMELLESAYKEIASAASDMGDGDAAKKFVEEAERQYREGLQNINQQRLESLYDYLREFGTIQEQIYAIEKQYNDKIAVEKDDNIKKQLQKKKEAAMAGLNAQNLAMNIDWSTAFSGVGNVLKDIAKETLAQVEKYMQKPEFKSLSATDKKSYVDLRDKLRNETGVGATSPFNFKIWGTIEQNVRDYQESVKKLKAAQEAHNAAIQDMKDADAQYTEAVKSGSDDMIKAAKDVLDAAQDAVNVTEADQGNAQAEADKAKQTLTDNTNAAAKGIQNFTNYLNEMSNGSLYGFANGITKLITSLGKGSDGVGKALGELGGKIGGIVGAILQILDALGDDPAQFIQDLLDKVANVVDKLLSTLLSEVVPAILEGVVNIIGSVIEGVGNMITFGGLGSIFGNHEQEYKDGLKSWEQKIAANTYAVEQLTKSMTDKSKTPQDAQKERDAALSALQGQISSLRGTAHYVADDSSSNIFSGYHSWYWKRNDEGFDYNRFNEVLAQHGSDTRVNEAYDVVNRLSAKDIQILRTYAGDAWADYFGYVDSERDPNEVKKYLEEIGDLAEKDKEIMDDWYASLTNMTFESLRDNFKSMLKDLSKDRDSFLSDFSDKMMDSLLDTMMSTSGLSQRLKEWQTKWGDYIASGNELSTEEVTALREEYQKLIDEGLAMRDEAARVTGYDEYQNTKQEADKKGFAGMSQDLGEEMNGRFTAVQIAGENISAQMNVAVPILTGIGVSMSRTAEMVDGIGRVADDMLTNIVECYTELNIIRTNTEDLVEIGKKHTTSLQKIADCVKRL